MPYIPEGEHHSDQFDHLKHEQTTQDKSSPETEAFQPPSFTLGSAVERLTEPTTPPLPKADSIPLKRTLWNTLMRTSPLPAEPSEKITEPIPSTTETIQPRLPEFINAPLGETIRGLKNYSQLSEVLAAVPETSQLVNSQSEIIIPTPNNLRALLGSETCVMSARGDLKAGTAASEPTTFKIETLVFLAQGEDGEDGKNQKNSITFNYSEFLNNGNRWEGRGVDGQIQRVFIDQFAQAHDGGSATRKLNLCPTYIEDRRAVVTPLDRKVDAYYVPSKEAHKGQIIGVKKADVLTRLAEINDQQKNLSDIVDPRIRTM